MSAEPRPTNKMPTGERLARAVILYNGAEVWTEERRAEWFDLTGTSDATSRALCNFARSYLSGCETSNDDPQVIRILGMITMLQTKQQQNLKMIRFAWCLAWANLVLVVALLIWNAVRWL